jgi:hypothetical protein
MSLNGVWRVRFDGVSVIVKAGPSATESRFYERIAPALRPAGVPIPDLYHSYHQPEHHWLVIEDIPVPLPVRNPNQWQPDPQIVSILARLHATTRTQPLDPPDVHPHHWHPQSTQTALGCLPPDDETVLSPILERLE